MALVVLHFLRLLQLIPDYGTGVLLVPNIRRVDEWFGGNEQRYGWLDRMWMWRFGRCRKSVLCLIRHADYKAVWYHHKAAYNCVRRLITWIRQDKMSPWLSMTLASDQKLMERKLSLEMKATLSPAPPLPSHTHWDQHSLLDGPSQVHEVSKKYPRRWRELYLWNLRRIHPEQRQKAA